MATNEAKKGPNLKQFINDSGGKGNFLNPCIINAIPNPNLKK